MTRGDIKSLIEANLTKLETAQLLIEVLAGYDTGCAGAVGEIYAEEVLGMEKAPRGAKAIDGYIDGRSVSVKTFEFTPNFKSVSYRSVTQKNVGLCDDLLTVYPDTDGNWQHIGPVPFERIKFKDHKQGPRYYLRDIVAAAGEVESGQLQTY